MLPFLTDFIVHLSLWLFLFLFSSSFQQEYFPDRETALSSSTSSTSPSPSTPWSSLPSFLLSRKGAKDLTMSHPCSATVWHNNGMHGAPAAAKAVVGCADHSLTMVRPAAVMGHSMRPRYEITAVLEEYIMHAGSFSRFRYMLLRFELTAAVSSNRSSDYYCWHRPCELVPSRVCGKDAADTTGFENRERSVSRLIYCIYLRVNFGGIRRLIPVVVVCLFVWWHA